MLPGIRSRSEYIGAQSLARDRAFRGSVNGRGHFCRNTLRLIEKIRDLLLGAAGGLSKLGLRALDLHCRFYAIAKGPHTSKLVDFSELVN